MPRIPTGARPPPGGGLPPEAVAEMTRDQLTPEQKAHVGLGKGFFDGRGWGFGLSVVTAGPDAGAFGAGGGLGASWLANPALDLTVIVLTQRRYDGARRPRVHGDLQAAAVAAATRAAAAHG